MKINHRLRYLLLTSCMVSVFSGCSTYIVHNDDNIIPGPYIGTKRAVKETARHWVHYDYYGQVLVYAMDVPLCLIADTVVLPFDLYRTHHR